jgi:hypothetical protein
MYSSLLNISLHLQPLAYYQQCPIIHTVFQRTKQCCTHFWQFSYGTKVSIQTSYCFIILVRVYCCVYGQEFRKNNTLLNPEDCSHDCSCWWHTLEFLLPLLCHVAHHSLNSCLDLGSEW